MCAIFCCKDMMRKFPTNYGMLMVITTCLGVICGFSSAQYTPQSVLLAVAATVVIFGVMTVYAWTTKTDFTGFGPYLFAAGMVLMVFGLIVMILQMCGIKCPMLLMLYNICGVLLFTFYIVYDTQLILGEWGGHGEQFSIDDYAFAALMLYLDVINLFLYLLALFGQSD
eukprot:NODE_23507_length_663_cov_3.813433.p1 GENE.NODE_23507_length_663_cov_3.813433~~NODE_23507_length_663_cov_3.813433.p1  ORF type:complete len:176 (-),score=41.86 NODE_23507_length_663_cov_3.813433:136-642(-)